MRRRGAAVVLLTLAVAACGTTPPADFKGRWKPVNRYSEAPTAIPLRADTAFYVSPLDRTLKGLLERWARDAGGMSPLPRAGFIDDHVAGVLYPRGWSTAAGILVFALILASWFGLWRRRNRKPIGWRRSCFARTRK